MTSDRASSANRRNAQASTGPRTPAGKGRSSQNARKHGLSLTIPNPETSTEIERIAKLIAGDRHADPVALEAARNVAEAEFQLQKVKNFKITLQRNTPLNPGQKPAEDDRLADEILLHLLQQLESLDRYERRALSRRKFAIRRFNELIS
ncbi:hypothetical protein [Methylobacterium sp.]|uniref:hypothetical protein n=1 Tax=Methylobacterium sp. TaxID=409 RepID=UPI003AFFE4A0